jgi:hypothetical protein
MRHIQDYLAVMHQAVRDMRADAVAALDRHANDTGGQPQ